VLLYDRKVLHTIIWLHQLLIDEPHGLLKRGALKVFELLLSRYITICHNLLQHQILRAEDGDRMVLVWMMVGQRDGARKADDRLVLATRRKVDVFLHVRMVVGIGATLCYLGLV
jgi:hypothetical protein